MTDIRIQDPRHKGNSMRRFALLGAVLTSMACYRYVPAEGAISSSDERVRIELTDRGSADLAHLLGPGPVAVAGRVIAATDSQVTLSVLVVEFRRGEEQFWVGESLAIPRPLISRVERRELSRRRTVLAAVTALVGAVIVVDLFRGGEALFGGKRDGDGTTR